jgi:uncharacterized protein (TIGR03435 family)
MSTKSEIRDHHFLRWPMKLPRPFVLQALLLVFCIAVMVAYSSRLQAQSAGGTPSQPTVPQWQIDAGGKMEFDVASVKQNKSTERPYYNYSLGPGDGRSTSGGLFRVINYSLLPLIGFAYQLTGSEMRGLPSELPKWATTETFDIDARANEKPTRDQMRLMVQSLLEDRFKLSAHYETRNVPVFALVSIKSGRLGPHLQRHSDASICVAAPVLDPGQVPPAATVPGGFPAVCGELQQLPAEPGPRRYRFGARDVTSAVITNCLNAIGDVDRPILDRTGIAGTFDFTIEFVLQLTPSTQSPNAQPEELGPTFLEALQEQLGLKLESTKGPVNVFVIDHVEEPSPN